MTSPARYQPLAQVSRANISQATAVEQSRAVAEVQAAVLVAQQCPRMKDLAVAEMRESTTLQSVAERAFFRFRRGGEPVTGPSIHLARELARCWGNISYGITELRRDDDKGESEMQAHAWDLQTNARNATTFVVPHKRDTKSGVKQLTDLRDIYENNANAGARRVRECIFAVLPSWFIDEAVNRCNTTLTDGDGVPLPDLITKAIGVFEGIGVALSQLEAKIGRPSAQWTAHDVAQLRVTFQSINRGEVAADDEFEPQTTGRVTAEEIRRDPAAETTPPQAPDDTQSTTAQIREVGELLKKFGKTTRKAQLEYLNTQFPDRNIGAAAQLNSNEITDLIEFLHVELEREAEYQGASRDADTTAEETGVES